MAVVTYDNLRDRVSDVDPFNSENDHDQAAFLSINQHFRNPHSILKNDDLSSDSESWTQQ